MRVSRYRRALTQSSVSKPTGSITILARTAKIIVLSFVLLLCMPIVCSPSTGITEMEGTGPVGPKQAEMAARNADRTTIPSQIVESIALAAR